MNNWSNLTAEDLERIIKVIEKTYQPMYVPTTCANPPEIFKAQDNSNHVRVAPLTTAVDNYEYFKKMWLETVRNMQSLQSHSTQPAEPDTEFVSIMFEKE